MRYVLMGVMSLMVLIAFGGVLGLSSLSGGEIEPKVRVYPGSPSHVYGDFSRQDLMHIGGEDVQVSQAGDEVVLRHSIPAGRIFREEADGMIDLETRINRGDYVIYRGILDDAETTYTVRIDFEPVEGPESQTRVTVSSNIEGPDRGDVVRSAGWSYFVNEMADEVFRDIERGLES